MADRLPSDDAPQPAVPLGRSVPLGSVLLGLDTCGVTGTVALARVGGAAQPIAPVELAAQVELAGRSFSAQLVPAIANLLEQEELTASDLAGVVVVAGPGSFTGVRVGLSAAKGLVEALDKPLIVLSRLATLAASVSGDPVRREVKRDAVLAVLDAGRGEYFCGEYRGRRCVREWLGTEAEIATAADRGLAVVVCEALLAERLGSLRAIRVAPPSAEDAIRYSLPRFRAADFDDPAIADANYLRRSDAELFARKASPASATP
ncbi:MAG: tRNA (adenosine(37)-N6)-threonylcarbamoyltransferase complex dimerization subunit type 1 TsaB [Acidobacteriaceae bacterium]